MTIRAKLLTAFIALPVIAFAQTSPATTQTGRERFAEFFKPLVGTWPVHILDRDQDGKVEYEATQLRDFRFTIGGAYVREMAIVRDSKGRQMESGMQLYGYDPKADRVLIHGFWGNSADRFVFVPARLVGDGAATKLVGRMTVTHPDGRTVSSESEMAWDSPERFVWRTYSKKADGSTYTDEQLTYSVSPVEVVQAR